MEICESDFKLKPVSDVSPHFDLELLYTVKPRGGEARQEFKNVAYGVPLESAIKRIAHYRVSNKHKEEAIRLVTYFKDFKKELDSLKKLLNGDV